MVWNGLPSCPDSDRGTKWPNDSNTVRLSTFALSLSKGELASIVRQAHDSARTANRTVLQMIPRSHQGARRGAAVLF